jgi:hypothetical protein
VRVAAVVLGLATFGGLIVLAVAGVSGATAVLVTGGAVVAMIGLGNLVGGRRTPDRAPYGGEPGGVESDGAEPGGVETGGVETGSAERVEPAGDGSPER